MLLPAAAEATQLSIAAAVCALGPAPASIVPNSNPASAAAVAFGLRADKEAAAVPLVCIGFGDRRSSLESVGENK